MHTVSRWELIQSASRYEWSDSEILFVSKFERCIAGHYVWNDSGVDPRGVEVTQHEGKFLFRIGETVR